jgi:hypothetical protein
MVGLLVGGVGVLLIAGLIVGVVLISRPRHPQVLNERTPARQVLPFTPGPDPLFDPLPPKLEKHGEEP